MKNNKESKYGIYFTTLNAEVLYSFQKKEGFTFNYSTNRRHKMNLKNLFKLSALMFVFLFVLSSFSYGQTTYFVDVQNGLDGYNGLQPNAGGPGIGPKQTITNAIAAASDGDIISVAYANGNLYNENIVYTVGALPNKRLTFTSTGGAPNVVSFTLNYSNTLAPDNHVTFTGPFTITTGLTLTDGNILGASNLTVGSFVSKNTVAGGAIGTVDSQLNYTGVVNFFYTGAGAVTTGYELVTATNTTNFGNLTTAAGTVTLNTSKTMKGVLTTGGALAIGTGNTLTITGTNAHTVAGNVTGGTLAFTLTDAASVTGNFNLPAITVSSANANTLTLPTSANIGTISASVKASVTAANAIVVGAVTNSGSGTVTLFTTSAAPTTVASVTNTSSGSVVLNNPAAINLAVTGNLAQSGSGSILVGPTAGAGTITVGGTVTNNPTLTLNASALTAASNKGVIRFGDKPTTVTGLVSVGTVITGATDAAAGADNWVNVGEVSFGSTTTLVTLTGGVSISSTHSMTDGWGAGGPVVSNCAGVTFATTTADILIPGGISISTVWPTVTNITAADDGSFLALARTSGLFGQGAARIGTINVTSSTTTEGAHGNFKPGATGVATGGENLSNITTSGGKGGYIILADEPISVSGNVTNSRSTNSTHLDFGINQTAGLNVAIGGNLTSNGASNIRFQSFVGGVGNETFTISGAVNISGGTVKVNAAAPLNGTGTFQFGSLSLSGGTLNLTGAATSIMDVIINGTASFTGGTLNCVGAAAPTTNLAVTPLALVAADRVIQLGGLTNTFSTATSTTTFTTTNTLLLVQPTAVVAAQVVSGNLTTTVWPGSIIINNPTMLTPAVTINGGNFRALGTIAFYTSQVKIDNITMFVGGQLLPNLGTGNFYNHAGYVTNGQGFISMNNNAAGGVFGGVGTFENFEVDCAVSVTPNAGTGAFTKMFNLTNGNILISNRVIFNNATSYPTIVRNAGTFAVAPTFTSMVNVIYIGLDKTTSLELPAAVDKLNDLTVATTNDGTAPLVSSQGAVVCGVATTVNGTLTVNDGQALVIKGVVLTMNGAVINLNNTGIISNVAGADKLNLARTSGTTINGTGWLPDISVAVNSLGNKINGARGLVTTFLGTDDSFGGAAAPVADFDPTAASANGSITFGAGAASLEVVFGAGASFDNSNLAGITTADASNVLTVSSNMTTSGNIAHIAGTMAIGSGFTWSYLGLAPAVTSGAVISGPGLLYFRVGPTVFSCVGGNVTVDAPVTLNLSGAAVLFQISTVSAGSLTLTNDFTITKGTVQLGAAGVGNDRNLTLTGKHFNVTANGSVNTIGIGILRLNATTANVPLLWSFTGNSSIGKLRVSNDATMVDDGNGPYTVTVGTAFTHDGGLYDFGSTTLRVDGTYNRTAGTYSQTATGYLIINNATFNQGATAFTIPNLQFGLANAAISPTFGNAGVVTVSKILAIDINPAANVVTTLVSGASKLTVSDGAAVEFYNGKFDQVPTYGSTIDLFLLNNAANIAPISISSTVWPATATLVQNLVVSNTSPATMLISNTVNKSIYYQAGTLNVPASKTLTVADNATIKVDAGVLTVAGSVSYGTGITMMYVPSGAAYFSNGKEIPSTVKDLSFTRLSDVGNFLTTLSAKPVTVTGTLTIKNDLTTVLGGPITLNGNLVIGKDAFPSATTPVTIFGDELVLASDQNTSITVPTGTSTIAALTINKTNSQNTVTLLGGNLATGIITFTKGLLLTTGDNYVQVAQGALGTTAQGFVRNVAVGDLSHIVGNVRKMLKAGIIETFGRNEFPVGSTLAYAPVAITTLNSGGNVNLGVNVIANYNAVSPTGFNGLPIKDGVTTGTDVARYASFYWLLKSDVNIGNTKFDLELTSPGFADYDDLNNVRIIRRMGKTTDLTNAWTLQGTQYNNFTSDNIPTVTNVQTYQGISTAGAMFTFGMKTRLSATDFSDVLIGKIASTGAFWPVDVDLAGHFTGPTGTVLTYTASSSNTSIATVAVVDNKLTISGVTNGAVEVTVRATDQNNDFITKVIKVTVNGAVGNESTDNALPTTYGMSQNYPNPFNPTTVIKYQLPNESMVTIKVINMIGQEVSTLVNEVKSAGYHTVNFNASGLASGRYIAVIKAGDFTKVIKMNLLK